MIPASVNSLLLSSGVAAYKIERSLRFNSPDTPYLSRTPLIAGERRIWTWSAWVKRSQLSGTRTLFGTASGGADAFDFSGDALRFTCNTGASVLTTTAVFRDVSAWYHIVLSFDSTQAVASNRVKIYVNGVQITVFSSSGYPSLNYLSPLNNNNAIFIGSSNAGANSFDGYMTDVHFINNQALDPTSFGKYDGYGIWQPKLYTGTFGVNGFHLDFADNSANTAAALGKDTSGNGNNWTPSNFFLGAGGGNDSLVDTPTSYGTDTGVGNEVRGNYATYYPLHSSISYDNGNLRMEALSGNWETTVTTLSVRSKAYVEFTAGGGSVAIGLIRTDTPPQPGSTAGYNSSIGVGTWASGSFGYDSSTGSCYVNNSVVFSASTYTLADIIGIAFDPSSGNVYLWKNGVSQNSGNPVYTLDANFSYHFAVSSITLNRLHTLNAGQRAFSYTALTGYQALCLTNAPVIAAELTNAALSMNVGLYTGNGTTQSFNQFNFSPGLVWIKSRSIAGSHALYDTSRGAQNRLTVNTSAAEATSDNGLISFDSNGFSLGSLATVNASTVTFVAWAWKAGSPGASNTDGTITSTVNANASAGLSIVTYAGNAVSGATIGHGLGVKPSLIIVKNRVSGNWAVQHSSLGNTQYLYLNTAGAASSALNLWANTSPTSSVFSVSNSSVVNQLSTNHIAYCFSLIDGYSAAGSYTGNGSSTGPLVFTNMRPRWILIKRTDLSSDWVVVDSSRAGYNVDNDALFPSTTDAQSTTDLLDILSNGFRLRSTDALVNAVNGSYVYFAIAEHPFSIARAR